MSSLFQMADKSQLTDDSSSIIIKIKIKTTEIAFLGGSMFAIAKITNKIRLINKNNEYGK